MKLTVDPPREWLSLYVYHAEPWEDMLCDVIAPVVYGLLQQEKIIKFFFIRYWEGGPHIRLRVETQAGDVARYVSAHLQGFFSDYLREQPSIYAAAESTGPSGSEKRNVVELIPYQRETSRYGGRSGMRIAERQFYRSSVAVLSLLRANRGVSYEHRLQAGVVLHLALVSAFAMDASEAEAFFEMMFQAWLWSACGSIVDLTQAQIAGRRESVLRNFQTSFDFQRDRLLDLHRILWDALEQKVPLDFEWCNSWIADMSTTAQQLSSALRDGTLDLKAFPSQFVEFPSAKLWPILQSYVHMTNNRLGILNRDEAFLAYIIHQCFRTFRSGAKA